MRDYGKVATSFWSSKTIRSLSEDGRTLAIYLLTCSHSTIAGVFRLPDGYVCEDLNEERLGWNSRRVAEGFTELFAKGFANRCETTKWVWIHDHFEWNALENPNQRKAALKIANTIPEDCSWVVDFFKKCGATIGLSAADIANRLETLPKPFRNQEQEQEQEQKQEVLPDISSVFDVSVADSHSLAARAKGRAKKPTEPTEGVNGKEPKSKATRRMPKAYDASHLRGWASANTPGVDFNRELAKMRDHQFRDAHSDWDAVVRNWLRRAFEQNRSKLNGAAGVTGSNLITHEQREAYELQKLRDRRAGIGLADFRDPLPNEPADAYRKAQDDEWQRRKDRAANLRGDVAGALKAVSR